MREGRLEGLSPLSILVGPNNAGKSTCLEAAALATSVDSTFATRLLLRRGGPVLDSLTRAFGGDQDAFTTSFQIDGRILEVRARIGGTHDAQRRQQAIEDGLSEPMEHLTFQWSSSFESKDEHAAVEQYVDSSGRMSTPFLLNYPLAIRNTRPIRFLDVEAQRAQGSLEDAYSELERSGNLHEAVRALRTSFGSLDDLRILKVRDDFVLHTVSKGSPPVPAYLAGDGFKRFIVVAAGVFSARGGIVFLEEPECYQHPRYLGEMVGLLLSAVKDGTTVVLSTHSRELIQLLAHGSTSEMYPTVHRLRLVNSRLVSTVVDHASVLTAIDDIVEDLRA